ncbi:phage recombination protein Bet [Campylobacter sp. MIT 19-121]|uniref:phage recombination protein Bet n=1 Tax=Campylobacter sp. MIT 19-121 TaxID=2703906 RepID=UPI00138A4155|nr:phage recombination protein Bet [Campylobacter sp. MIT 19-121]NDJ27944.1 phage recombination protein Bet [Campylobacter sp. MIT 19-121]
MSNLQIIKHTTDTWLNKEEIEFVKKQFFPQTANELDIAYCLEITKQFNLNPITKQIFFVPRRAKNDNGVWIEKVEPLVGRDGFLAIAHKSGEFGGIVTKAFIKEVPKLINNKWKMESDLVAVCEVFKKGCEKPFIVEVAYGEYVQLTKEGKPTQFWQSKPETMIKKVAESQALRKAFNISGLMALEEVGIGTQNANGEIVIDAQTIEASVDIQAENAKLIKEEQVALEALGLKYEYKEGWIKVIGSTYGLSDTLIGLNYSFYKDKGIWAKKLTA